MLFRSREALKEGLYSIFQRLESIENKPCDLLLQNMPEPFNRIQLRALRRQKDQSNVLGDLQGFSRGIRSLVHEQQIESVGEGLRELF